MKIAITSKALLGALIGLLVGLMLPYAPYSSLGLAAVFACIGGLTRYLSIPVIEEDVYERLNFDTGRTALEIRDEMNAEQGLDGSCRSVSQRQIYSHLNNLVDEGSAERRARPISNEKLREMGGLPQSEWILIESPD